MADSSSNRSRFISVGDRHLEFVFLLIVLLRYHQDDGSIVAFFEAVTELPGSLRFGSQHNLSHVLSYP